MIMCESFDDFMNDPSVKLFEVNEDIQSLINYISSELRSKRVEDFSMFESYINSLFLHLIQHLDQFHKKRFNISQNLKIQIVEIALKGILADTERLSNSEQERFYKKYEQFMEEVTKPVEQINFKLFDIDKVTDLQVNLFEYLQERDQKWFKNFSD